MKFIKTADGEYINTTKIHEFHIGSAVDGYPVYAKMRFHDFRDCVLNKFSTEAEAQAWLDKFITKLNTED